MENVRGMRNKIDEIQQDFAEYLGEEYQYSFAILNAQDYGVPQNRERFIMIGNRLGINPKQIFEEIYRFKRTPFLLKDVLEGLPSLRSKIEKGKSDIECVESGFTVCEHTYLINDFYHL